MVSRCETVLYARFFVTPQGRGAPQRFNRAIPGASISDTFEVRVLHKSDENYRYLEEHFLKSWMDPEYRDEVTVMRIFTIQVCRAMCNLFGNIFRGMKA